jgi:hypothetical protein
LASLLGLGLRLGSPSLLGSNASGGKGRSQAGEDGAALSHHRFPLLVILGRADNLHLHRRASAIEFKN